MTRYKAQRLAHKADAAKAATSQARVGFWHDGATVGNGAVVNRSDVDRDCSDQRIGHHGCDRTNGDGGASPAAITDNGVTWWPLQELSRPAPLLVFPSPS